MFPNKCVDNQKLFDNPIGLLVISNPKLAPDLKNIFKKNNPNTIKMDILEALLREKKVHNSTIDLSNREENTFESNYFWFSFNEKIDSSDVVFMHNLINTESVESLALHSNQTDNFPREIISKFINITEAIIEFEYSGSLENDFFDGLKKLTTLCLKLFVDSLDINFFKCLKNLVNLYLESGYILSLEGSCFSCLNNLKKLKITGFKLNQRVFDGLTNLIELEFQLNGQVSFSSVDPICSLKKRGLLDGKFDPLVFSPLVNLKILIIGRELENFDFLSHLPDLECLTLFSKIEGDELNKIKITSLKVLKVGCRNLIKFGKNFQNLKLLKIFEVDKIKEIDCFENLKNLKILSITNKMDSCLEPFSTTGIKDLVYFQLSVQLSVLNVDNNYFTELRNNQNVFEKLFNSTPKIYYKKILGRRAPFHELFLEIKTCSSVLDYICNDLDLMSQTKDSIRKNFYFINSEKCIEIKNQEDLFNEDHLSSEDDTEEESD